MDTSWNSSHRQSGFSMIEVMVTIIILLVGLLGLAGLMVQSQRSEMESYQRVQALILLQDMVGRINANRNAASCYAFTTNANGTPYLGTGASAPTANIAGCKSRATDYALNPFTNDTSSVTSFCTPAGVCTSKCNPASDCSVQALAESHATAAAVQGAAVALSDLQAWHNVLLGAAEKSGAVDVGAMIGARGCISYGAGTELLDKNGIVIPGTGIYTIAVAWQGLGNTAVATPNCAQGQYGSAAQRRVVSMTLRTASLSPP